MDVSMNQALWQKQQLSTQMLHSLTILRMNALELRDYINTIALENPVVEILEPQGRSDAHIPEQWRVGACALPMEPADRRNSQTLAQELRFQLLGMQLPSRLRETVEFLVGSLDPSGYLSIPLEELASAQRPLPVLREALLVLQSLEPRGVGARSLSECLCLQLAGMENSDLAVRIASNHLQELAHNRLSRLPELLGCSYEEVERAAEQIRRCEPKPANGYCSSEETVYTAPELYIFENEEQQLQIVPDEMACPYIQINPVYQAMCSDDIDAAAMQYLREQIAQATAAIGCIAKRNLTLMQCAQVLVQEQEAFFRQGPTHLRPLSMHTVAEKMGVSESTVSRALNGKYFRCAWGFFPLKHLVQRSVCGDAAQVNAQALCAAIAQLVAQEKRTAPRSDQELCRLLEEQGICVSRRTVAKYRELCHIAPASQRKQK